MIEKNIILVEMKKDSLLSVSLIMKFSGYKVTVCNSFNEAWGKIYSLGGASSFCDLLITDIHMSCLPDEEMIDRRSQLNKEFPIYVLTDFVDGKTRKDFKNKGIYIIEKPIQSQELLRLVNKTFHN